MRNLKSRKIDIFGNIFAHNWPFFHLFILGNTGQENVFCDVLNGENAFPRL